ncbi:hypothetical protein [Ralstonia pseudosolanacearum]|uniref:hypothetical protein n=1 Tax=Ralstonia pseudosolanacearum TaxID=1310165 RepID=UPI0009B8F071|nr:hypothetical protein [Ralstonia pseudosolanacearum]MDO3579215.1 hypothetical protein [Ralstonia pseudosolanacearum]MDO3588984.1 hypothetical protein [Ralstonia pseudosolanacearum]
MTKLIIDRAQAGQKFFQLPAYSGTPTATVNGSNAALTATPNGVVLTAATNQDDTVAITFGPVP